MKGMKFISFFAVSGFVLSFLFGLFSHTSFLSVLLKALLFAVIFGILGFLINIVFDKFLADDTGDLSSDYSSEDNSGVKQGSAPAKGQLVDITIQDEDLVKSEGDNHFVVGENHQMLNESDMRQHHETQHLTETETVHDENPGFVPLKKEENLKDLSGKEAVSSDSVSSVGMQGGVENGDFSNSIDTLPDMNHIDFAANDEEEAEEIDTDTDSDFNSSASYSKRSETEVPEVKDAALIAKAISSVLSGEDS